MRPSDTPGERAALAHERAMRAYRQAAAAHERACRLEFTAAEFWERHGKPQAAEQHRHAARRHSRLAADDEQRAALSLDG
ncbi:MAG TPA: hypothetical protein VF032_15455 [Thermoleophilaceae bacterium]